MADDTRPNPDVLLAAIEKKEAAQKRGKLKVFLGMCPGVGKTYAMLEETRREHAAGRDVVIGYVETHGRRETDALAEGVPCIPRRQMAYRGITLLEMDLDALLTRRPQLALVDELAHTNAPGSRHPKRYQDVLELLDAGIDVLATLNIQHVESRAEAVRQITGVTIQETLPDTALDGAELVLVDLPPAELRVRLAEGKVYVPERSRAAQENFFRPGNLTALRELALRFAAEHVGQDLLEYRQVLGVTEPWKSGQRLLVAVSSSPTSATLLRWTRRLAGELHAPWLAVSVEQPRPLSQQDQARLERHLALARDLGAQVLTTSDEDLVHGLLRVAREHNATQLVVGKPAGWRLLDLLRGGSFLNRLIGESGNIDVHVVRADGEAPPLQRPAPRFQRADARAYALAAGVVAVVTAINLVLQRWIGYHAVSLINLVSVVGVGLFAGRGPTLAAAALTALSWNFFFTAPRLTLRIASPADSMSFATYFVVALAMGHLTSRLRAQQAAERRREQHATALYLLTRELAKATDLVELLAVVMREVGKTFQAEAAISLPEPGGEEPLTTYFASTWNLPEKEFSVAAWAFQHRQPAGRGTDTLPSSEGLHLPLMAGERAVGVLSLRFRDDAPLASAQRDLLAAFVPQIALVLDRQRLRDEEQQAELLAKSERLTKTLLDSLSHEVRTPIAVIVNATTHLSDAKASTSEFQQTMVHEIQQAAGRLNRLVSNVLDMTRLESGHVQPKADWCDVADLVQAAVSLTEKELKAHNLTVDVPANLPPVKMDFILTQQALTNLLLNAALYTPAGTRVEVRAGMEDGTLVLTVADRGPGLPAEVLPRIFEKFYRAPSAPAGGTGLGLSIVKGFIEAQGGRITAESRPEGGTAFAIRLPAGVAPPIPAEAQP